MPRARRQALREPGCGLLGGVRCDFRRDCGHHLRRSATPIAAKPSARDVRLNRRPGVAGGGGDFVGPASYVLQACGPLTWLRPGAFGTLGVGAGIARGAALAGKPFADCANSMRAAACRPSMQAKGRGFLRPAG